MNHPSPLPVANVSPLVGPSRLRSIVGNVSFAAAGVAFIIAMAQISIPLGFTPVPITLQSFAVLLITLMLSRPIALSSVLAYLALGFSGVPVFKSFSTLPLLAPTSGYLFGMLLSTLAVGWLVERGCLKSFLGCGLLIAVNSLCLFGCGLAVLSFFVPVGDLLWMGFLPFVPGDLIKSSTAIIIARNLKKNL